MTHFNPMKGPGNYGEPDVPPSQDLEDYDPTVYQVFLLRVFMNSGARCNYNCIFSG